MDDRFTRIRIAGFRRLRDVDLPLRDLAIDAKTCDFARLKGTPAMRFLR